MFPCVDKLKNIYGTSVLKGRKSRSSSLVMTEKRLGHCVTTPSSSKRKVRLEAEVEIGRFRCLDV